MKKALYFFLLLTCTLGFSASTFAVQCDQEFPGTYLRYDKGYKFYDVWNNGSSQTVYIRNRSIRFLDDRTSSEVLVSSYLDAGSAFDWTQTLKNSGGAVGASSSMRIIETGATNWRVQKKPTVRTTATKSNHDFMIYYKVGYDFTKSSSTSDDASHVECQYFSVTWCGDGVRDAGYEICDPNDPTQTGWGNGGCNQITCEPINVDPVATCDGLTATPLTGIAPFTTTLTCTGTNATAYQIACGNGQVINGSTGTCTYALGSNYTAKCNVNGTITSPACTKTITVVAPTPLIEIDKRDANGADLDGITGTNDSQTVATGTKAVFKIRVTNKGNESLNNLKVTDAVAPNCAGSVTLPGTKPATWSNFVLGGSGNHNDAFLEPGEYFDYTCEHPNTLAAYDNRANTEGTGITSGVKVTDTDDTKVLLVTPSIQVVKTDANTADLDGQTGNDTQTVNTGDKAVFKIRVTNNGTEDLKSITLSDTIAPNCSGSMTLPSTKPATWSNFVVGGAGNPSDAFLQPGEYFDYTCEKLTTTAAYTNEVLVNAVGRDSNVPVTDDDPTLVKIVDTVPACISLNAAPLTGAAPVNSNVVCTGEKVASFKIDCGNGQILTKTGINAGQESFAGICNYTTVGTFTPKCFINNTVTSPACQKTVTVTSTVNPAIQLVKSDANPADLDGNIGNDTQTVAVGTGAIFRITVTNTGTEGLNNIVLTDAIAPNCAGLVTLPSTRPATFGNFVLTGNADAVFNPGETFTYTCSRANTTANYTNTANVTANGITSGATVNSTDPTQVIIPVNVNPSILIDKVDANSADRDGNIGNDTQTVNNGSGAVFKIRVTNNGPEALRNIVLSDTLAPNCAGSVTLPSTRPATFLSFVTAGAGDHTDTLLQPSEYFEYTCEKPNTTAPYTNIAGVTGVGNTSGTTVTDDDSSPVLLSVAPSILIDKVDANTADTDGSVGNDTQTVAAGAKAVFKIRVTNNGGEDLKNLVLSDSLAPNCAGSVTLPSTKPATFLTFVVGGSGNNTDALLQPGEYFEYTCEKDNTTASYTNVAGVTGVGNTSGTTVTDDDSSPVLIPGTSSSTSSSGGGSPNDCYSIEQTATTIRCVGDNQTKNFRLDCGNGETLISNGSNDVSGSTRQSWDFPTANCKYDTKPKTGTPTCYVATRIGGEPSWRTRFQCQLTDTRTCGDGILQAPEQCEKTIEHTCSNNSTPVKNADGDYICSNGVKATAVLGTFPSFCNACKINGNGSSSGGSSSGDPTGVITIPNHGNIVFGPIGNMVIGHGKNPLVENGIIPFIRNDSDYDLAFDQLCVTKKTGTTLDGTQTQCKNLGDILYPGEIVKFDNYPLYTGNKNNIPANQSYGSNDLITTIKTEGQLYDWAFFASKLGVRVSKPAITTTGGGTSLVKDTTKMADISQVADGISGLTKENNKNFVGVGVGGNTSSYSDTVTNSGAVQTIVDKGTVFTDSLTTKVNTDNVNVALANITSLESSELKSYNGLQNVFILKGKNLVVDSIPSGLRGATTYIVEGGDLIIDGNLNYAENIAFVVKGGNIRVDTNVTKISGTYIAIPVNGTGGKIIAEESDKQLVVAGSLYGNISDLVGNRNYIDNNSTKGVINVGTIVSFGSSLFKKPAPLVGQFISEYLATQKVAQ